MTGTQENSISTVDIYMRNLRALFNEQIAKGLLEQSSYPFGRYKYQIPASEERMKVISKQDLQALYEYAPAQGTWEDRAKDLFFFLYLANGMNVVDMCKLKFGNINGEYIDYVRAKTETKVNTVKPISVFIDEDLQRIIDKWGNTDAAPNNYIFPFFYTGITPQDEKRITQNLTGVINDNMNRIAQKLNLAVHITTYSARQTFGNMLLNSGENVKV